MAFQSLGRGLGSLIPQRSTPINNPRVRAAQAQGFQRREVSSAPKPSGNEVVEIPISQIDVNPNQPRNTFDHQALEQLTASIKRHGILQPLIVMPAGKGYQLIAGERRLRAAKMLSHKTVPALVRTASEQESLELALVENLQRQDLNPLEEAESFQKLMDEFGLTQVEVAERMGRSRSSVANTLRFLQLPDDMQKALRDAKISEGHAKILAGVEDARQQRKLFDDLCQQQLTVRDLELRSRGIHKPRRKRGIDRDPNITAKEERLQEMLGTPVRIYDKSGKGSIQISFFSSDELSHLVKKLTSLL